MLLKCTICQDHHSSALFTFLLCGHGFCSTSLEEYRRVSRRVRGRWTCPICRVPFLQQDTHPIFVDSDIYPGSQPPPAEPPVDAIPHDPHFQHVRYPRYVLKQAACVGDSIRRMAASVTADNVERVGKDIQQVLDGLEGELYSFGTLLSAVADFLLRIVAVFNTVTAHEKEIASLNSNITSLRAKLKAAEIERQCKVDEAKEAERLAQRAVDTADQARVECVRARDEADMLRHRMEALRREHRTEMEESTGELGKLRSTLVAHKKKESKQKDRITELKQQLNEKEAIITTLRQSAAKLASTSRTNTSRHRNVVASSSCSQLSTRSGPDSDVSPAEEAALGSDFDDMETVSAASSQAPQHFLIPPRTNDTPRPQGPQFITDWNLPKVSRKRPAPATTSAFPITLDAQGRARGTVQLGSRQKLRYG
ncbi:hypothetical protein B0H21DRAFT_719395 [Amylocystis lapponica]|nr:hypothetical protein B0H21DRAFT_719395 [Amylocystis lapponica]